MQSSFEDIIDTTVDKFHWNQHNLFLNRGATAIMHTEIWSRFLMARDEIFKTDAKKFMSAITVGELVHEDNAEKTPKEKIQSTICKKK